ncbi:tetratricopeptide repeat protein [Actinoplanes sp. LDG1-06]|uniref:Tetratricopeptide repeat protein n=1 Tax=Paractinoplanes ovalisporus TaxID=2810368 RepID=A0ABS2A364_9ACTN|nr:tetratricopeptide repeat protein [Actinoplanes ovalisporus]MBM2614281.1 tetratricopeptide repeat protein [Actinoplanes ovalisporus]
MEQLDLDRWHASYRKLEILLADRGTLTERAAKPRRPTRRGPAPVVPAQLPADVVTFTGRSHQIGELDELLSAGPAGGAAHARPSTVVISAIDGTAGVGKTALAVHWAHRVVDRFSDGQLYLNLRGFDPDGNAMNPHEAVGNLLDAFHVEPHRIPASLDAQAALYRSLLAGKRVLILLDNARDSDQVRQLLPGTPGCFVMVTSRNLLTGLVAANGAHSVTLDLLSYDEAHRFVTHRLGADRTIAEPEAVKAIITACARLPLALALATAHAATRPTLTLGMLAEALADRRHRLETLAGDAPSTDIEAVFSWSYHTLTASGARLFRHLGLHVGPDISASAATSLAGVSVSSVGPLLAELTLANLLVENAPGRYAFHDLLRVYAAKTAAAEESDEQRRRATRRMLDHLLHSAHTAALLVQPTRERLELAPFEPGVSPENPAGQVAAMAWFTSELPVLLAAVNQAATTGFDVHTWQLAWVLTDFLERRGHWRDWTTVAQAAVAAADRLGDPAVQSRSYRLLGYSYIRQGQFDEGLTQLQRALVLYQQLGDLTGQAYIHLAFTGIRERVGRYADGLHHARQALDLYQETAHVAGQGNALNSIGWCLAHLGRHEEALSYCRKALGLHQEMNNRYGQAQTWDSIGFIHHDAGHHPEAVACYLRAIEQYRELDRFEEADTLVRLGDTYDEMKNATAAQEAWEAALVILEDIGHPNAVPARAKLETLAR